jgi:hypothetical protein
MGSWFSVRSIITFLYNITVLRWCNDKALYLYKKCEQYCYCNLYRNLSEHKSKHIYSTSISADKLFETKSLTELILKRNEIFQSDFLKITHHTIEPNLEERSEPSILVHLVACILHSLRIIPLVRSMLFRFL